MYDDEVADLRPEGARLFDAHVHVGHDIDGFVSTLEDLLAFLARDGVERAFAFCLDDAKSAILNPTSQAIVEAFELI